MFLGIASKNGWLLDMMLFMPITLLFILCEMNGGL